MELYKKLLVKILESNYITCEEKIIEKMKKNIDLTNDDKRHLEELIDRII